MGRFGRNGISLLTWATKKGFLENEGRNEGNALSVSKINVSQIYWVE